MLKQTAFAFACILLFPAARLKREGDFSKYRPVETYEIRPGILIMPKYSANGQVCEIAVEKSHYSSTTIDLDSSMPRQELIKIIDELVLPDERGRPANEFSDEYLSQYSGNSVVTFREYENVSIRIYGVNSSKDGVRDVVAVAKWTKRKCEPN